MQDVYTRGASLVIRLAVMIALVSLLGALQSSAAARSALDSATSWAFQLQGDLRKVEQGGADIAVVDWDHVRLRTALSALQRRPDRSPRLVLSYLSIGEAESSRAYWRTCCEAVARPPWLTDRTRGWPGNFAVRYWDADWRRIVKERLTEIIAAGFDGVYLDRIDTYEIMRDERVSARADMIGLVRELSRLAKASRPGFLVFVQNAEELLADKQYLAAIDGIGKEDLLHGINHDGLRNPADVIAYGVRDLQRARKARKPVLAVEYLPEGALADQVRQELRAHGFIPLITGRGLSGEPADAMPSPALAPRSGDELQTQAPSPPAGWSESEIATARLECSRLLAGLELDAEEAAPLRRGVCGVAAPLRIKQLAGVKLHPPVIANCPVAAALHRWIKEVLQPAAAEQLGAGVARLETAAGYDCRARVAGRSGLASEHAFANAIDIGRFVLADGRQAGVRQHWGPVLRKPPPSGERNGRAVEEPGRGQAATATASASATQTPERAFLLRAHRGACGIFSTVLGPEANDAHLDHFHLDLAPRRRNAYCE